MFSFSGGLGFEVVGFGEEIVGEANAFFLFIFFDPRGNGFHFDVFEGNYVEEVDNGGFWKSEIVRVGVRGDFGRTWIDEEFLGVIDYERLGWILAVFFESGREIGDLNFLRVKKGNKGQLDFGETK
jgi:hypothetical protein